MLSVMMQHRYYRHDREKRQERKLIKEGGKGKGSEKRSIDHSGKM